jgi:hypothetical protein
MDRKDGHIHYHIRWARTPLLDWKSFSTQVLAEAAAKLLAHRDETYTIEEHGEGCQRCREAAKKSTATAKAAGSSGPLMRKQKAPRQSV